MTPTKTILVNTKNHFTKLFIKELEDYLFTIICREFDLQIDL